MFTRIHHISIAVRSLEQALSFYRDVLGIFEGTRATIADQGVTAVLLPMNDGEIELLEPVEPAGGVARFLERRGEGLHHLCLETPDVGAVLEQVKAAGLPLIDKSSRPGLAGMVAFLHPAATQGILVEFAQPLTAPAHPASRGAGIQAVGLGTVYAVAKDLADVATAYARNFQGSAGTIQENPLFGAREVTISIGSSRITFLSPADGKSPVGCFLAERGEGLFGVCLRVMDLEAAFLHLEAAGISIDLFGRDTSVLFARLDPARTNGVNLFLAAESPSFLGV